MGHTLSKSKQSKYRKEMVAAVFESNKVPLPIPIVELQYEGRAKNFLIIPDEILYSSKHLSHGAKITWMAIFKHNWADLMERICWPGVERLATIVGVSGRQQQVYLKELKDKQLLLTKRRKDKTNLYVLLDPPVKWMKETKKNLAKLSNKKKADTYTK